MLYYRYCSAVEKSPKQCLITTFLSSFEVLYVDIMFTKETGHLYLAILGEHAPYMRIAAIYTNGSAFGGSTPPIY